MENLNVVFAIDNSGSMGQYQVKVQGAMVELIEVLRRKFSPYVSLIRFGYTDNYCAFVESGGDGGRQVFNLSMPSDYTLFTGSQIWGKNKQTGYKEEYYATLKYAAGTPFTSVIGAQNVIILLGDETEFDENNFTDCKTGVSYTNTESSKKAVAEYIQEKGAQVFVIQKQANESDYEDIVNYTHGGFYNITAENYDDIADAIGLNLKYKCQVEFKTIPQACGELVPFSIQVAGSDVASTEASVAPNIKVERTAETVKLNDVTAGEDQTVSFDVTGYEECANIESAEVIYSYVDNTATTEDGEDNWVTERVPATFNAETGVVSYTIPGKDVKGDVVRYSVVLKLDNSDQLFSSPYITQSDWQWEFTVGSKVPVIGTPVTTADRLCSTKHFSVDVENADKVILHYMNSINDALSPNSIELTKNDDGTYTCDLSENVSRGFYYYIEAVDEAGHKAYLGSAGTPLRAEYELPETSEDKVSPEPGLNILPEREGCGEFTDGGGSLQLAYYCDQSQDYVVLSTQHIDGDTYSMNVPLNTSVGEKINGFTDGDKMVMLYTPNAVSNVTYNLSELEFSKTNSNYDVCLPIITEELEIFAGNRLKSLNKVLYGDTISYESGLESSYRVFTIKNKYNAPILINHIDLDTVSGFELRSLIHNDTIQNKGSYDFTIDYTGAGTGISKVTIYNSTLENPFVFYVRAFKGEKEVCASVCQSVMEYSDKVLAYVNTTEHLNNVCLALVDDLDDTLAVKCLQMGGPATQGVEMKTDGMQSSKTYSLVVKVDDKVCHNAYRFNEQQAEDTIEVDNCKDIIKSLSVDRYSGMMVGVSVEQNVEMCDLEVYTASGKKTEVHFGPQLMGGPTVHNLQLNTTSLANGTYVLKTSVGDHFCSKTFVVVK